MIRRFVNSRGTVLDVRAPQIHKSHVGSFCARSGRGKFNRIGSFMCFGAMFREIALSYE